MSVIQFTIWYRSVSDISVRLVEVYWVWPSEASRNHVSLAFVVSSWHFLLVKFVVSIIELVSTRASQVCKTPWRHRFLLLLFFCCCCCWKMTKMSTNTVIGRGTAYLAEDEYCFHMLNRQEHSDVERRRPTGLYRYSITVVQISGNGTEDIVESWKKRLSR